MMEGTREPPAATRTEHALAFATYSRRFTQGVTTVALLHPTSPNTEWTDFVDHMRARLTTIAGLLGGGEAAQPQQPRLTLPPGEEQGQGTRLRRQVEVLERSTLGLI